MTPQKLQDAYRALISGRPDETLKLLEKSPDIVPVLLLRGGALATQGQHSDAVGVFEKVLKLDSSQLDAAYNLAVCQQALGRFHAAKQNLERVLEKQPDNLSAMLTLSTVLAKMGFEDQREALLKRAIELAPSDHRFRHNLARLYFETKRFEDALEIARDLVREDPDSLAALTLLGDVCMSHGKRQISRPLIEEAVSLFERARELEPNSRDHSVNLGNALNALTDSAKAVPLFEQLAQDYPMDAGIHYGLGLALSNDGRRVDAYRSFQRSVDINPDYAEAQHKLAVTALGLEDFEPGSEKYEWRWQVKNQPAWRQRSLPLWQGEPLRDGRLLVWSEQGLGDQLMHFGWLRWLDKMGIPFGVECEPRLVSLLKRSYPAATIYPSDDMHLLDLANSEFKAQCPSGDLLVRTRPWERVRTAPARYLETDNERRDYFRQRLASQHDGPKVGVSWYSKGSPLAFKKSRPLSDWLPILSVAAPLFVNLQYGDSEEEFEAASRASGANSYCDPELDRKDDLEGLCALIDSLDLIITVSNVTAHFAGALGKPCWVLLGSGALWHWGSQAERAPFYPTVRTFRVGEDQGWHDVLQRVAQELEAELER